MKVYVQTHILTFLSLSEKMSNLYLAEKPTKKINFQIESSIWKFKSVKIFSLLLVSKTRTFTLFQNPRLVVRHVLFARGGAQDSGCDETKGA